MRKDRCRTITPPLQRERERAFFGISVLQYKGAASVSLSGKVAYFLIVELEVNGWSELSGVSGERFEG